MARTAREAYRTSETINDAVEIHVGVLMVEAQEIVDAIDTWRSSPSSTFDFGQLEESINLIAERVTEVQNWTDEVLGKPISFDE